MDPPVTSAAYSQFYVIGLTLVLLGFAFLLLSLIGSSGALSNFKISPIILYVYKNANFYFVTSPILIIASIAGMIIFLTTKR